MTPKFGLLSSLFIRLILLICASLAVASLTRPFYGYALMITGLLWVIWYNLQNLLRLAQWLDNPNSPMVISKRSGLWQTIFKRLGKTYQVLEHNTQRLVTREARYRKTLTALPEGIILVRRDWTVTWANTKAQELLKIDNDRDAGRHLLAFVTNSKMASYFKHDIFELPFIWHHDGDTLEVSVVEADANNRLVIIRDISEQERLDAMRRDFVANLSHELRTPLTVLKGFLDIASDTIPDDKQTIELQPAHLNMMREQADRMQRLVTDLLTLSRLESGSQRSEPETFNLSALLNTITQEIQIMAKNTHTVHCQAPDDIWLTGYPDEVRSAIVNLMTNAVRYTPNDGTILCKLEVLENGELRVTVQDNGIGIQKKDIPRLTERFYRVDKSRSRDTGGTGLGLAIVKHVLLHHHAHLEIESEFGKGSSFSMIFPSHVKADSPH